MLSNRINKYTPKINEHKLISYLVSKFHLELCLGFELIKYFFPLYIENTHISSHHQTEQKKCIHLCHGMYF